MQRNVRLLDHCSRLGEDDAGYYEARKWENSCIISMTDNIAHLKTEVGLSNGGRRTLDHYVVMSNGQVIEEYFI